MTISEDFRTAGPSLVGRIVTVTIRNPPVNTLGAEVRRDLTAIFRRLQEPGDVRVAILRGADGRFCAGGDISELARQQGPADDRRLHQSFAELYDAVGNCPIPVIAVIERYAMGGGFELALRCDLRYATPDSRFAASGVNMGLVESAHTIAGLVSPSAAAELLFSGDVIDGGRAEAIGLITKAVPPDGLNDYVDTVATRIATRPPLAVRQAKRVMRLGTRRPDADRAAAAGWLGLRSSHDHAEALRAFLDHDEPTFEGR